MSNLFFELTKDLPSLHSKFYKLKNEHEFSCTSYKCSGLENDLTPKSSILKKYNKFVSGAVDSKKLEKKYYDGSICNRCGAIFNPFSWTGFEGLRAVIDFIQFIHFVSNENQILNEDDGIISKKFREIYRKPLTQRKLDSYREMMLTFLDFYGFIVDCNGREIVFQMYRYLSSTPSGELLNFRTYYDFGISLKFEDDESVIGNFSYAGTKKRRQFAIERKHFDVVEADNKYNNIVPIYKESTSQKFYRFTANNKFIISCNIEPTYFIDRIMATDNVNSSAQNKLLLNGTIRELNITNQLPDFDKLFHFIFLYGTMVNRSTQTKQSLNELRLPHRHLIEFREFIQDGYFRKKV